MYKSSSLKDRLVKLLVGTEKLAPKVEANLRKVVTTSGRMVDDASKSRGMLKDILIGQKGGLDVVKARLTQGGLIGPGGAILGDVAIDPKFKELVKNIKASKGAKAVVDPRTGKAISKPHAYAKLVGGGALEGLNPLFGLGYPLLDIHTAVNTPDHEEGGGYSGILRALGSGAGFAVAGPLGLVGGTIGGELGGRLGGSLGGLLDPEKKVLIDKPLQNTLPSKYILDEALPPSYT
tara:strand:- start:3873 stop:4577 length:705 start_codon:yes stop_codon:yes gene_type:complete